jgi:lipoprotein signal peptidase
MRETTPALRSGSAVALLLLAAAALLAVDLASKQVAWKTLVVREIGTPPQRVVIESRDYIVVQDWLHFHATANQGAVFGIGQGKRWLFLLVSVAAVAFIAYLFSTTRAGQWPTHLLLAMFLAGVLGNMYDRLTFGYVRDMIFALPGVYWPGTWQVPLIGYPDAQDRHVFPWIFNLADSYLCVGVAIVLLHSVWPQRRLGDAPQPAAPTAATRPADATAS